MTSYSAKAQIVDAAHGTLRIDQDTSITPPAVTDDVQIIVNLANVLDSATFVKAVNQCITAILKSDPFTNG